MSLRVAFATLGCKVNQADTALIRDSVSGDSVEVVPFGEPADVYVINTCTVTAAADRQSRQLVHRAHRQSPGARVVVTGCLADLRPAELERLEGVSQVVGNADKDGIARRIAPQVGGGAKPVFRPGESTRPPVKIQDGCAGSCAYCTVAAARGRPRSVAPGEVLEKLRALGQQGCVEAVLTGIDLGSYGRDLQPPQTLAGLLDRFLAEEPLWRLRLSSVEVHRLSDEVLALLARAGDRLCRHLHLPLQSGSDAVLGRMRRPYDRGYFEERVRAARERRPGLCIGSDVIAGLPGEREADHRQTLELCGDLRLAYLHVFPFSPRPSTPAASMAGQVAGPEARRRARELRELGASLWRGFRDRKIGQLAWAVVEGRRRHGRLVAFTDHAIPVEIEGPDHWMGRLLRLELTEPTDDGALGRPVDQGGDR